MYGSSVKVVVNRQEEQATQVKAIFGSYVPDLEAERFGIPELKEPYTKISFTRALDIIRNDQGVDDSEFKVYESEGLSIYDKAIFQPRCPNCTPIMHDPKLCWHVVFSTNKYNGAITDAFIDATNGEIVHIQPRVYESRDINVYDFSNQNQQLYDNNLSCLVEFCPLQATTVFTSAETTYDYFNNVHNRDSYDGNGTQIEIYIRMPVDSNLSNCNAEYSPSPNGLDQFRFEDGTPSLDVFAHEYTHGVHWWTSGFVYQNESGAIAEHIADAYAMMIGHWSGLDSNWKKINGCGDVGREFDAVPVDRDHYYDYLPLPITNDHGGVHRNCEILNNGFYLMAGGTFTGPVTVQPVDEDELGKIYLFAMKAPLSENPTFQEFAYDITQASRMLYPMDYAGVTCQIWNAFAAIGLDGFDYMGSAADIDCDGVVDHKDDDVDGDGVLDLDDNCALVPNGSQADHDIDGIGDACDDDDDDDDGVPDDVDNCALTHNPHGQADDFDGDGIGDMCDDSDGDGYLDEDDNCPSDINHSQVDYDNDGLGNECDLDIDGDGFPNNMDNCPLNNGPQTDTDADSFGDLCDNCVDRHNPDQIDTDGDRVGDRCDSCDYQPNPDQADGDNDGIADACDNCSEIFNPKQPDLDNDFVGDICDNCLRTVNSWQTDCDEDGIGDACDEGDCDDDGIADQDDNCPFVSNSDQRDGNGNGIGDWCDPFYRGPENNVPGLEQSPFDMNEFFQFFEPDIFGAEGEIPEVRFGPICPTCPQCPECLLPTEIIVEAIPWGYEVVLLDKRGQRTKTTASIDRGRPSIEQARGEVHLKAYLEPQEEYRVVFRQEREITRAEALENTRQVRPKFTFRLLYE